MTRLPSATPSHKVVCAMDPERRNPTYAVWLHGDSVRDVREDVDGVPPGLAVEDAVSLEVKADDVRLRTQPRQVPRDLVALAHGQAREVPVHKPVDG